MRPRPAHSRIAAALALAGLLAGCAGLVPGDSRGSDSKAVVEPTLVGAAAQAEGAYDYRSAASYYATLHARHPENQEIAAAWSRNLRMAGTPQQAIEVIEAQVAKSGATAVLLTELGKAHLASDHINLAIRYLSQARDKAPSDWQPVSSLGVAYDYAQRFAEAQALYREALALSPDNPVVLNNLGLSQAMAGDLDGAVATLRAATDQPRATAQVRQNLALALALKGDVKGAERMVRQDLTGDAVRDNLAYYRLLATSKRSP